MNLSVYKFGHLQPLERIPGGRSVWICMCDCGSTTKTRANDLTSGRSTSCGCERKKALLESNTKHGQSGKRPYTCYKNMIRRCHNPNDPHYPNHGGRGIIVCDRWREGFANFWEDMKDGYSDDLTIERKDNDGSYCKENCIWADAVTQQNNKRNNNLIKAFGESLTSRQWSRKTGISHETIRARLRLGWRPEDAVAWPANHQKYYNVTSASK